MPYLQSLYPAIPDVKISNFYGWLVNLDAVKNLPDFTLYTDGLNGNKRRLREFFDRVAIYAAALSAPSAEGGMNLNARPEEMVGIFSENSMEYPTAVFSLLKIAVPFALLPAYSTAAELASLIKLSEVTRLLISPSLCATALEAAGQTNFPLDRIYVLQGHVDGLKSLDRMVDTVHVKDPSRVAPRSVPEDHLAYLAFSSGTSGVPKAVMISHKNLYYSAMQPIIYGVELSKAAEPPSLAHTPEGVRIGIAFLPFYHATAMHLSMLRGLTPPTTTVILPRWDVDRVLEIIEKYRVTNLAMVPSMTQQMMSSPKFKTTDFSSVMMFITGAAHLAHEHRKVVLERLPKIPILASTYGLTECTVTALQLPAPGLFLGRFSETVLSTMTGILLPGMEARIVRENGSEADFDEPGELLLRGGNVALGYWKNQKASAETFSDDGWLRTGDRFTVDRDGAFFYVDRSKDTLKVSGAQVSPSEIEHVLLQHPDKLIKDVTVAGVPGPRFSDEKVPRAWVVLSDIGRQRGDAAVVAALYEWVLSQVAGHKILRGGIEIVNEIPKSPTGKVLRRLLQEKHIQALPDKHDAPAKL